MDEHDLMEIVRELVTAARNGRLEPDDGEHPLADSDEWRTPGDGASFGVKMDDGSTFVITITQVAREET